MRISARCSAIVLFVALIATALPSPARAVDAAPGAAASEAQDRLPESRSTQDTAEQPAAAPAGGCGECAAAGGGCGCMQGSEGAAQAQMSPEAKAKRGCGCKHAQP
jgi:hypothetical protein